MILKKFLRENEFSPIRITKPGNLLQVFFLIVLCFFAFFVIWETYRSDNWLLLGLDAPKLETRDWLFLIGMVFAIAGWVCSSIITLRNSVKQHTVATFVQSRLSSPYAELNKRVNLKFFSAHSDPNPLPQAFFIDPKNAEDIHDINTVLNYFEFIAVGIRYGDLDELMLKQIMRSIISNMCWKANLYIDYVRSRDDRVGNDRTFEHLLWLNKRWNKS